MRSRAAEREKGGPTDSHAATAGGENRYGVCPNNAVLKLERHDRYAFGLDYRKGWRICVAERPGALIEIVAEAIRAGW